MRKGQCRDGMEVIITKAPQFSKANGYRGILRIYGGDYMSIELPKKEIARYKANKGDWFVPRKDMWWSINPHQIEPYGGGFAEWARRFK